MNERSLIKKIQEIIGEPSPRVRIGLGDDAAVVAPACTNLVATTDALVEGVHFDLNFCSCRELGYRSAAVNLSDLAAMAASPLYLLVSLCLPSRVKEENVCEFYRGLVEVSRRFAVDIIGGNLSRSASESLVINITALGEVEKPCLRTACKAGDLIAVTGALGRAAAGLIACKQFGGEIARRDFPELVQAYLMPTPRVREAQELARSNAVTAMIDVSDGLSSELYHLMDASPGCGMRIERASLPIGGDVQLLAERLRKEGNAQTESAGASAAKDSMQWIFNGGDDFELLLTLDQNRWREAVVENLSLSQLVHVIGEVDDSGRVSMVDASGAASEIPRGGWDHFRAI